MPGLHIRVERVRRPVAAQDVGHRLAHGMARLLERVEGAARRMGRQQNVVHRAQRVVLGRGFIDEHVQRRAGDSLLLERLHEVSLVDHAAAAGVDQIGRPLHLDEFGAGDKMPGAGHQRRMHGHEIRSLQQTGQIPQFDVQGLRGRRIGIGIIGRDLAHGRAHAARDLAPDAPEADQPQNLLVQAADRQHALAHFLPFVAVQGPVADAELARDAVDQGRGVVGHFMHAELRQIADDDAVPGRRVRIHAVHADAVPLHEEAFLQAGEHFLVERGVLTREENDVRIPGDVEDLRFRLAGRIRQDQFDIQILPIRLFEGDRTEERALRIHENYFAHGWSFLVSAGR